MKGLDDRDAWPQLERVRELRRREAQAQAVATRAASAEGQREAQAAQQQVAHCLAATERHQRDTIEQGAAGGLTAAAARLAGGWDRALARHEEAARQHAGEAASAARALQQQSDADGASLRHAAARVEAARRLQERLARLRRALAERREEAQLDDIRRPAPASRRGKS
jgi:flagellar biosynthesis chaperone FliJ